MAGSVNSGASSALWNEADPMASLAALYNATLEKGRAQTDWYKTKVRPKRFGSQACRFAAILLFGLAALIPLVKATGIFQASAPLPGTSQLFEFGYVAAALAAGLIAFDKYFGLSTGWIRYIQTELVLEGALDELQYDWIALLARISSSTPQPDQVQAMIQRLHSFIVFVNSQTQQETQAWVMEFQSNLADLEKSARLRAQAQKPGTVEVTIGNAATFDPGLIVCLDGANERRLEGRSSVFTSVPPGAHIVLVKGTLAGKTMQISDIVRVQPDAISLVSLTLPTS